MDVNADTARILVEMVSPSDKLLADGPLPGEWPACHGVWSDDAPLLAWRAWRVEEDGTLWSPFARPDWERRGLRTA